MQSCQGAVYRQTRCQLLQEKLLKCTMISASSFEEGVTVAINSKQLRKVGTRIALFLNDEIITQRA